MLMQKMSTRKEVRVEAHNLADDGLGKEKSMGAQNLSDDGERQDDGSRCVFKNFYNRRRKGDACSKRAGGWYQCEKNVENVEVNGMTYPHASPSGCIWAKPMDENAKVKVLQPEEQAGWYSKRFYERGACELGNDEVGNCKSLNDMTCTGGDPLQCLKWGDSCYAGRVEVPEGFRVSGYHLSGGWYGDLCLGGKYKPEVGQWTNGNYSFWNYGKIALVLSSLRSSTAITAATMTERHAAFGQACHCSVLFTIVES